MVAGRTMTAAKENGPSRGKLGPKSGRNNAGGAGMTLM